MDYVAGFSRCSNLRSFLLKSLLIVVLCMGYAVPDDALAANALAQTPVLKVLAFGAVAAKVGVEVGRQPDDYELE